MKKLAIIVFTSAVLLSCGKDEKKKDLTILSGNIEHPASDTLMIMGHDFVAKIPLQEDGSFTDTLDLPEEDYYTFRAGQETTGIFLSPGTKNFISINTDQFDESLKYTGDNAAENNYLAQKYLLSEKLNIAPQKMATMPEDSLIILTDENQRHYLDLLKTDPKINPDFVTMEQKALSYQKELKRQSYSLYSKNGYYKGADAPSTANLFPEELDLDQEGEYSRYPDYRQLVNLDFYKKTSVLNPEDSTDFTDRALAYVENVKSESIKKDLLHQLAYEIRPGSENAEELYNEIMTLSQDEDFKTDLTKKYETIKKLEKGNPSPSFTYENHDGGNTSLEDLKGKYVYIDVWATWCGPCLGEIPSLKKVEEEYKNKNITFVSISIDTDADYDKWKKMVDDKDLAGVQLIADNNWHSDFVENYAIQGIPRFLLLDPDGNIISADAPRPSNPELKELFKSLSI